MKTKPLASFLVFSLVVLAGCATATFVTGRDFDTSKISLLVENKTTAAELIEYFGQPYGTSITGDGSEVWSWLYSHGKSHAQSYVFSMDVKTEMTGKRLTVTLKNGVVQKFSFTDGPLTAAAL